MKLKHAGYFEGIGGFSLGAERSGIETIYTCEIDDYCHTWLKQILPNATHERDITTAIGCYADIFTAGFPCQDISKSNPKGEGLKGKRSGLFYTFMEFVRIYKPRYVILENSPMLISSKEILSILREFAKCGYDAEWQVISKRQFGYPDERKRLIFIAYTSEIGRIKSAQIFSKKHYEHFRKKTKKQVGRQQLSGLDSIQKWETFIANNCQNYTGIPRKLAAKEIECYGNAICPDVAQLAFELIKIHNEL